MTTKTPARFEYATPTRRPPSGGRHTSTRTHRVRSALRNTPAGDRFVPSRASTDLQFARFKMSNVLRDENSPPNKQMLDKLLELQGVNSASKTLHFNSPVSSKQNHYWRQYSPKPNGTTPRRPKRARKLPKTADRVLDAPNLLNDFYLNVLDWGRDDILAVALKDTVYLLNTASGDIDQLSVPSCEYVSSLAWSCSGQHLALGTSSADVQLWDVNSSKMIRRIRAHSSRVSSLAWNTSNGLLSSGSQQGTLINMDSQLPQSVVSSTQAHTQDVCGLTWNSSGRLLASGGNDNLVKIWDMYNKDPWTSPAHILSDHTAAVKALSWCPWEPSTLASGGGSADQRLCVWNACTGSLRSSVETGGQVSGLVWAGTHRELLSSHGNPTNDLAVWSCDSSYALTCTGRVGGHDDRVLHLTASADVSTVVTAGGDETLRFWKIFNHTKQKKSHETDSLELVNLIR